jgi:hypothetical protein
MAATDLVYNTTDPVLYTPDYAFLRYTLDKKQSRYDQGLDAVSSAYNKLKTDLTDPVLKQRRDQFLKDAQGQLQKIASSDLSLSQNIAAANNVFDPLATNPAFNFDAYHTKRLKDQNEIMNEWANSPVEDIRKQFNPELQRWMNRDLEVLRNGKGDINNYKNIQNRQALAYLDPLDILSKAAKDYGFEFKYDQVGSPYIVRTDGGKDGIPNYNEFARTVLGGNQAYQRQVKALGEARSEDVLDLYKSKPEWEGKTDKEKFYDFGLQTRSTHRTQAKTYLDETEKNLNTEDANLAAYFNANKDLLTKGRNDIAAGDNTTDAAQALISFQNRTAASNSLAKELKQRKDAFDQTYGANTPTDVTFATSFSSNPKQFFSDQQYDSDVQSFINIRSASVSRQVLPDNAYLGTQRNELTAMKNTWDMMDDMQDNYTAEEKVALQALKLAGKGQKIQKNADGTTSIVSTGGAEILRGSASATQLYTTNAIHQLQERVTIAKGNALNSMVSASGALSILPSFGLTNEEAGRIKALFNKQFTSDDPTKAIGLTAEDKKTLQNLFTKAGAFAKNAGIDFDQNAFTKLTAKDIPFIVGNAIAGYTPKNMNEAAAMRAAEDYNKASQVLVETNSALQKGRQAVAIAYGDPKTHPEFRGMFTTKNGLPNLIDESDISKWFETAIPNKKDRDAFAKDYADGKIQSKIILSSYEEDPYNSTTMVLSYKDGSGKPIALYGNDVSKIPVKPEKYQELVNKINKEIQVPSWTDEQGMMLANPRFMLTEKTAEKMALELSDPTQSNANIYQYKSGTDQGEQIEDSKTQLAIRGAMKDGKNLAGVTVFSASPLNNGGMVVQVTMSDSKREDSKKEAWEGQTYYFPINVNQTTPEILRIFGQVNEVNEFEQYKKEGKDFVINTFQGTGIKAIFHPNMPGDNTGSIEVVYKPWDPKTKTYGDWQPLNPMEPYATFSLDKISFPQMKDKLYEDVIYPHVQHFIEQQKQNLAAAGVSDKPLTLQSFLIRP